MYSEGDKIFGYVLFGTVTCGLALLVVGVFLPLASGSVMGISLISDFWDSVPNYLASPKLVIISLCVAGAGAAALVLDAALRVFPEKDLRLFRMFSATVSFLGMAAVAASGFFLLGDLNALNDIYSPGVGLILMLVGSFIATTSGALAIFQKFRI